MRLAPLDKAVLRLENRAAGFLKAYATNTPDRPLTAFVDLKGRIVAVCDQLLVSEDAALLTVGRPFVARLTAHLEKYLALWEGTLREEPFSVYHDLDGGSTSLTTHWTVPQKTGKLLINPRPLAATVAPEEYALFRVENARPLQGVDYDEEMLLNVFDGEAVSYEKGCFLGQEILARVHHRSKPPKKLVVRYRDQAGPEEGRRMTSVVREPGSGREKGFLFVDN